MFPRVTKWSTMILSSNIIRQTHGMNYIDRIRQQQKLKDDDAECFTALESGQFVYYYKNRALVRWEKTLPPQTLWIPYEATHHAFSKMKNRLIMKDNSIFLDTNSEDSARFALQLYPMEEEKIKFLENMFGGRFAELRSLLPYLQPDELSNLTKGRSLLYWHKKTQFCCTCGSKTARNAAGSHRVCTSCRQIHYPTLSPVIIVLAANKHQCVLARQPRHPPGVYSAIAGYVEYGETLDQAVRREIAEEIGIEVGDIEYMFSQHWPFPMSSLMLGFLANTKSDQMLNIDKRELEDAQWFDLKTVKTAMKLVEQNPEVLLTPQRNTLLVPPPGLVAFYLLQEWIKRHP